MADKLSRIALTLIYGTLLILTGCSSLNKTIREIGYTPVVLPSTSHRPGKLVSTVQSDPFQGETVCEHGSYIGTPSASKDEAASIQASQKLTGSFSLGGDYLRRIKADATYRHVTDLKVSLSNVSVEEIPVNKVFEGLTSQDPYCTEAIEYNRNRSNLGFLQKALKADADYEVTFDQKVAISGEAQQELLKGLAPKLGANTEGVKNNRISGKGLYWGVFPPRPDLVFTPYDISLQIRNLQLLDEKLTKSSAKSEKGLVLYDLQPRNTTDFRYKEPNELLIAFIYTVYGHTIRDQSSNTRPIEH